MRRIVVCVMLAVTGLLIALSTAFAATGSAAGGKTILSEASIWRNYVKVNDLKLKMEFRGGVVVYLNGSELISTARFEMLREGIQEAEARWVVEEALKDRDVAGRLSAELVKRCESVLKARDDVFKIVTIAGRQHNEGWKWYAGSGWEDRAYELYTCAGEVVKKR